MADQYIVESYGLTLWKTSLSMTCKQWQMLPAVLLYPLFSLRRSRLFMQLASTQCLLLLNVHWRVTGRQYFVPKVDSTHTAKQNLAYHRHLDGSKSRYPSNVAGRRTTHHRSAYKNLVDLACLSSSCSRHFNYSSILQQAGQQNWATSPIRRKRLFCCISHLFIIISSICPLEHIYFGFLEN
jgi:hypothetical protein